MQITPPFTAFDAGILILAILIVVIVAPILAKPPAVYADDEQEPEQDIERRYRRNEGAAE